MEETILTLNYETPVIVIPARFAKASARRAKAGSPSFIVITSGRRDCDLWLLADSQTNRESGIHLILPDSQLGLPSTTTGGWE